MGSGGIKATKAGEVGALFSSSGERVPPGFWLVVEDGQERILSDAKFKAEFEPEGPSTPSTGLVKAPRDTNLMPSSGRPAPFLPEQRRTPGGHEVAHLTPGLNGLVKGAMSPDVLLPGREITDGRGNVIMRSPAMRVDTGRQPRLKDITLDAEGNVVSARVEPEEWPPRNERFGG